jgi:transcriptional repressor NrdR
MDQINEAAGLVRQAVMQKGKEEITSKEIGDLVMKYLKELDRVAYIRFASVYKKFEEPEDFRRLLLEVKK